MGDNENLVFKRIEIQQQSENETINTIRINNEFIEYNLFAHEQISQAKLFDHGTSSLSLIDGGATQTVYCQIREVKWQVRNAIATLDGNTIQVNGMRSNFQDNHEIVFTPCQSRICRPGMECAEPLSMPPSSSAKATA